MPEQRYRHRPTEVEALQWTGDNSAEMRTFVGSANFADLNTTLGRERVGKDDAWDMLQHGVTGAVRDGRHGPFRPVMPNGWVLSDANGFHVCTAERFAETYASGPAADIAADAVIRVAKAELAMLLGWPDSVDEQWDRTPEELREKLMATGSRAVDAIGDLLGGTQKSTVS